MSIKLQTTDNCIKLHRIKCLKSPERDIDLKFLECKVMLIIFLSLD
jgi:hypothetical protein